MEKRSKLAKVLLVLVLIAAVLGGCAAKTPPPGASLVGGAVGKVVYAYHYWAEGLGILVWHDFSYGGEGCSGTGSTEDPVFRLECNVQAQDGRTFDWTVHTTDGVTAEMWIDGQPIDLSKGRMFLIRSGEDGLEIVQLVRDFSPETADNDVLAGMAISDPDVAEFIIKVEGEE